MRAAADLEDSTEKHVAMENRLYPMREMLGDLLLETGHPPWRCRPTRRRCTRRQPAARFLRGGQGGQASGDAAKARDYFEKLAALGRNADPDARRGSGSPRVSRAPA
jgi:hypothetical protein